jgi:outer membrane protein
MKNTLFVSFFIACILIGGALCPAVAADAVKIGVVDLYRALNESDTGKKAKADLESLVKAKQSSIDEKGKAIEKLRFDLEKQVSVLSPEAKKAKEEELERLIRDYQRIASDSQTELKKKEGELTGSILNELREYISKIAQEDGYSLILENAGGVVLYFEKTYDVTDKVIRKYNDSKAKPAKK